MRVNHASTYLAAGKSRTKWQQALLWFGRAAVLAIKALARSPFWPWLGASLWTLVLRLERWLQRF